LTGQANFSIAIGISAGQTAQATNSIAIGNSAGFSSQGSNAIAIGNSAGQFTQASNSIVLNASGNTFSSSTSGTFINPIRNLPSQTGTTLMLNPVNNELFTTNAVQNINSSLFTQTSYTISAAAGTGIPFNAAGNGVYSGSTTILTPDAQSRIWTNNNGTAIKVLAMYSMPYTSISATGNISSYIQDNNSIQYGNDFSSPGLALAGAVNGSSCINIASGGTVQVVIFNNTTGNVNLASPSDFSFLRLS